MTTPPRVHRAQLDAAMGRIRERRRRVDDPHGEKLTEEPAVLLDALRKYPPAARSVAAAEVADALVIHVWNWWEHHRRELALLRAGKHLGHTDGELGAAFGIGGKGLRDRRDRLEALLRCDRPNERLTRETRRAEREQAAAAPAQHAWIHAHHARITQVAADLLTAVGTLDLADGAREWCDELATELEADAWGPAGMVMLALATDEARTALATRELARHHPTHRALRAAETLQADYTTATSR